MTRLRELITESKFLKREFGEPLPTFNGVMEKYKVNKLKEDWWSNMSAKQQAAYVKAHPKSKQAQDAKDKEEPKKDVKGREYDPKTGKGKGTDYRGGQGSDEEWFASMMGGGEPEDKPPEGMASDAEKRMTQIDKERESLSRQYNRLDQPGADKSGEGKAKVMKKWDALDAEYDELEKSVGDEPESDPGSKWDKHSTKVKATSPEHQKEIDSWMKKYSNPKGGVDWDQAKKDNAPFPKGEPKELEKGAKVTAKWTGVTGDEQSIPDGEIEDTKYNEDGTVDSYNIRWNNGNNLINLSADKVKGEEPKEKRPGGEQAEEDEPEEKRKKESVTNSTGYSKVNEGSMDWEKHFKGYNEKELKVISKFIWMNPQGIDGVIKMSKKKDFKPFVQKAAKKGLGESLTIKESVNKRIAVKEVYKWLNENDQSWAKYYSWRNDKSMTPKQKIGMSMREVRDSLQELERIVNRSIKLKKELKVGTDNYWKSTHSALRRIHERLVKITGKIANLY